MTVISVALVGTGAIAKKHVQAVRQQGTPVVLSAAMDLDATRVQAFCAEHAIPHAYTDVTTMLHTEQPQLVLICTPPAAHLDLCVQCMEAGAWVLCEKPLCASLAEMDALSRVEERTGCYTSVVAQRRFGSGAQHLKRLIEAGDLGSPLVAVCLTTWYRDQIYYQAAWRGKWALETGGVTATLGIHLMDLLLWLWGDWREVRAMAATLDREIEVETVSSASVLFEHGGIASITNSVLSPRENTYLRLDFQRATVELDHVYRYSNADWRYTLPKGSDADVTRWQHIPAEIAPDQAAQLAEILACIATQQRPLMSGSEPRRTLEFITALYKAAFTGQPVFRNSILPTDPFYHAMNGQPYAPTAK